MQKEKIYAEQKRIYAERQKDCMIKEKRKGAYSC